MWEKNNLFNDTEKSEFVFLSVENNRSEETTIQLPEYIAVTSLVLCSLVLGVGVLGNLLVIIVILTNKLLRSSTNLFLLNLSVADLLVLVTCTPTSLVEIITKRDAWILGRAMCFFVPFIELSVSHTSVLTILAITVERYYAICLPLQAGVVWTKSKACFTCLVAWLFAFGLTAPVLAMIEYTPDPVSPVCLTSVDNFWSKFYFVFIITVFFFIPLLILILLYRHIANHLVPNQIGDDEQVIAESSAVIRSRRQVVAMLIAVVFFFFACILPFKVLTLWIVASPLQILDVINEETYFNLLYFSRLMFYINSAINPILYNIMSSKFRDGFKRVFNCKVWTSGRHGFGHSSIYTNGMVQTTTGMTGLDASPANRTFMDRMNSSILLRRSPNRSTVTTAMSSEAEQSHFFVNSPSICRISRSRTSTASHHLGKKPSLSPRSSNQSSFLDDEHSTVVGRDHFPSFQSKLRSKRSLPLKGSNCPAVSTCGILENGGRLTGLGPNPNQKADGKRESVSGCNQRDAASQANNPSSSGILENIVFIEERKIILIPTSATNTPTGGAEGGPKTPSSPMGSGGAFSNSHSFSREAEQQATHDPNVQSPNCPQPPQAYHHHHHHHHHHTATTTDINFTSNPLFLEKLGSDELVI